MKYGECFSPFVALFINEPLDIAFISSSTAARSLVGVSGEDVGKAQAPLFTFILGADC